MAGKPWLKVTKIEEKATQIDGVDTAEGLVIRGTRYARRVQGGIRITPDGHALLGQQLAAHAADAIQRGEGNWEQPVGRPPLGGTTHEQ